MLTRVSAYCREMNNDSQVCRVRALSTYKQLSAYASTHLTFIYRRKPSNLDAHDVHILCRLSRLLFDCQQAAASQVTWSDLVR